MIEMCITNSVEQVVISANNALQALEPAIAHYTNVAYISSKDSKSALGNEIMSTVMQLQTLIQRATCVRNELAKENEDGVAVVFEPLTDDESVLTFDDASSEAL